MPPRLTLGSIPVTSYRKNRSMRQGYGRGSALLTRTLQRSLIIGQAKGQFGALALFGYRKRKKLNLGTRDRSPIVPWRCSEALCRF